jgi:hypothetical protein
MKNEKLHELKQKEHGLLRGYLLLVTIKQVPGRPAAILLNDKGHK